MHTVLHIMPHMGPGVGKALSALAMAALRESEQYRHKILLLEQPVNFTYISPCQNAGIEIVWPSESPERENLIAQADIVQLEWWHHPLVLGFLRELSRVPIRLTTWSHISGCSYPSIPVKFVKVPEHFFFATAYSYENASWPPEDRLEAKRSSSVAVGSGGFENVADVKPEPHEGFNIGYVGTLDFRKLHPNFVDFCASVDVPDTRFVLVGNTDNKETILDQVRQKAVRHDFEFAGFVKNVRPYFASFDIFAYLLNPYHFGATDNALLEAMAAGMAIIVLNQCGEKHVIRHNDTGLVVNSKEEFAQAVKFLHDNPNQRKRLGIKAMESALSDFSPLTTMRTMHPRYDRILSVKKRFYDIATPFGETPYEWFLSGLGQSRNQFERCRTRNELEKVLSDCPQILKGSTKSSISHFYRYFPSDPNLKQCEQILTGMAEEAYVA